jgi:hypothetical protein
MLRRYDRYELHKVDSDRYAVTKSLCRQILGYALLNDDETWSIELRDGKVVEVCFASLRCAADTILALGDSSLLN